jgi:hypothetical protein
MQVTCGIYYWAPQLLPYCGLDSFGLQLLQLKPTTIKNRWLPIVYFQPP